MSATSVHRRSEAPACPRPIRASGTDLVGGSNGNDGHDALAVVFAVMPGAQLLQSRHLGDYAIELAAHGWEVLPLNGKVPSFSRRDGGHGLHDATTDPRQVADWWRQRPDANIGARVPPALLVLDIDPRHDGDLHLTQHEAKHGRLPETLTVFSGRGDGGRHLYFRRPPGKLTGASLGPGIDLKVSTGYVVVPPSLHPESGQPYRWHIAEIAAPPVWLVRLLRKSASRPIARRSGVVPDLVPPSAARSNGLDGVGVDDTWADILTPHGWRCLDEDGDADDARWLHPAATSTCSATVRHGCLFVYSTNTPLEVTVPGEPRGYTRRRAYSVLNGRDHAAGCGAHWGVW